MQTKCRGYVVDRPVGIVVVTEAAMAQVDNLEAQVFHDRKIFSRLNANLAGE